MRILVGVIWLALSGAAFITVVAAKKEKDVKASFKLTDEDYIKVLSDQQSAAYKELEENVTDTVGPALIGANNKIYGFHVKDFRNGSGSVIVDSLVLTTEQKLRKANKIVLKALRGVDGMDPSSVSVGVRLCVPAAPNLPSQEKLCAELKSGKNTKHLPIICIEARDRYECLQMLNNAEVDLVHGNAADVYLAHDLYGDKLRVFAETREKPDENEEYQYKAVAVVRRSSITNGLESLKGSKSCHTGYGKTSGWYVPISKLLENGIMSPNCSNEASVVENDLHTVSSFFGEACIPGKWVPIDETNTRLKQEYKNLCSLCANPTECSQNDAYAGDEGALECLIESDADVAWTKLDEVDKFFDSNNVNKADFGLLCYDGRIVDIGSSESDDCYWAARPWPAWLTWRYRPIYGVKNGLVRNLKRLVHTLQDDWLTWGNWAKDVLGINENSIINKIQPRISPYKYLYQAGYYTTISQVVCPATPVRLCVVGAEAEQKCKELGEVLNSRRVRPDIACVVETDEATCVDAIADNKADIITLDGGDVFKAYSSHGLIPVTSEVYGVLHVSYYAVAVVKKGSTISSLEALQNKKSCHTGIGKSAGWNVPVITLLNAGLLSKSTGPACDYCDQMASFFFKSCAPGASLPKYGCNTPSADSLCSLCVGDAAGLDKCARNSNERFYGYTGAFRCLVEGGGDVAFIKSTTVPDNTGKAVKGNGKWNQNLNASDYQLLCKDGTQKDVSDYDSCHWASVPSHKVVTRDDGDLQEEQVRILLLRAAETLPLGQNAFAMFGVYDGHRDVIFKSSATSLVNLNDHEFSVLRDGIYWQALEELGTCP